MRHIHDRTTRCTRSQLDESDHGRMLDAVRSDEDEARALGGVVTAQMRAWHERRRVAEMRMRPQYTEQPECVTCSECVGILARRRVHQGAA